MFKELLDRVLTNWKTTAGGLLAVAGVVYTAVQTNYGPSKAVLTGAAVIAGLTGLLAKDN